MPQQQDDGSPESRPRRRPIHCDECTIQIGDGYQESIPFDFIDESEARPQVLTVCWRCWESLTRRKAKRVAEAGEQPGVVY